MSNWYAHYFDRCNAMGCTEPSEYIQPSYRIDDAAAYCGQHARQQLEPANTLTWAVWHGQYVKRDPTVAAHVQATRYPVGRVPISRRFPGEHDGWYYINITYWERHNKRRGVTPYTSTAIGMGYPTEAQAVSRANVALSNIFTYRKCPKSHRIEMQPPERVIRHDGIPFLLARVTTCRPELYGYNDIIAWWTIGTVMPVDYDTYLRHYRPL